MSATTEEVWEELDEAFFGVLAFSNRDGHPRTAGVCYVVNGRSLLISTARESWKVRHIAANPNVAMTVTIPKRVPFLPFIKVPAASISFKGDAEILEVDDIDPAVFARLPIGKEEDSEVLDRMAVIRVIPRGRFATYGIGMSMLQMRGHEAAHGRTDCGTERESLSTG